MAVALAQQLAIEALVVEHGVDAVADQIGCLFDIADGFQAVLADLHADRGRDLEEALADQISDFIQQMRAFGPGRIAPAGEGSFRGRHRSPNVIIVGLGEFSQQPVAVDGRAILEAARAIKPLAVDIELIAPAQIGFERGYVFLEVLVQQRIGAAERGIGHFDMFALRRHDHSLLVLALV